MFRYRLHDVTLQLKALKTITPCPCASALWVDATNSGRCHVKARADPGGLKSRSGLHPRIISQWLSGHIIRTSNHTYGHWVGIKEFITHRRRERRVNHDIIRDQSANWKRQKPSSNIWLKQTCRHTRVYVRASVTRLSSALRRPQQGAWHEARRGYSDDDGKTVRSILSICGIRSHPVTMSQVIHDCLDNVFNSLGQITALAVLKDNLKSGEKSTKATMLEGYMRNLIWSPADSLGWEHEKGWHV